jgi:hypothetical protein
VLCGEAWPSHSDTLEAVIAVYAADLAANGHTYLVRHRRGLRRGAALGGTRHPGSPGLAAVHTALVDYPCERYARAADCRPGRSGSPLPNRPVQLVSLLLSIRDYHRRLGTADEFTAYVTSLRTAQKRKRNLIRLMDEHGL